MDQEKTSFKDTSYLKLWWPFCSAEQCHLCNFGRGHHEEHFSGIIFEFGPVVQEKYCFNIYFLSRDLASFCSAERLLCKILIHGIMRNISVKLL